MKEVDTKVLTWSALVIFGLPFESEDWLAGTLIRIILFSLIVQEHQNSHNYLMPIDDLILNSIPVLYNMGR